MMNIELLDWFLGELRMISHVEVLRIGTRIPVVLPQRITDGLISILRKYHPLFISLHFSHPAEITDEWAKACNKLADDGFPLGSQTVLLKDINDNVPTIKELMHRLLKIRVRPYYLFHCDPVEGADHFRTDIDMGVEMMEKLRSNISGLCLPLYVLDTPGERGKIPLGRVVWPTLDGSNR